MKRVIVESPFAGDLMANALYLEACIRDCLLRGEAPFASHGLYPGALCDDVPSEREAGVLAGFAWREVADLTVVYTDLGISPGMRWGIDHANLTFHPIEYRTIPGWEST
jgi:hypothetical protein